MEVCCKGFEFDGLVGNDGTVAADAWEDHIIHTIHIIHIHTHAYTYIKHIIHIIHIYTHTLFKSYTYIHTTSSPNTNLVEATDGTLPHTSS